MLGIAIFYHLLSSLVLVSRAQIESCTVSPESYFFKNGSFTNADNLSSSCESSTKQSEIYLTCSQASINDGNTGPQNFNDSSPADYYNWTNGLNQIEFRFSQNISFTRFKVFFYVHQNSKIALPKLRLLLLMKDDDLECTSNTTGFESFIDPVGPDELAEGLQVKEGNLNGSANAVLLCILPSKQYTLALTEIQFCTTDSRPTIPTQVSKDIAASTHVISPDMISLETIIGGSLVGATVAALAIAVVLITVAKKLHTKYKFRHIKNQMQRSHELK